MRLSPAEYELLCSHIECCFRGDALPSIDDGNVPALMATFRKLGAEMDRVELQRLGNFTVSLALRRLTQSLQAERTARMFLGKKEWP